jgi:hypothetical protein
MSARFVRLPENAVNSVKLASRRDVNPSLSFEQAMDEARFRALLERRFGASDDEPDLEFSYAVRDTETGHSVRVYAGQSGPAYGGGSECFVDYDAGDYRVREDVLGMLRALDAWLEDAA